MEGDGKLQDAGASGSGAAEEDAIDAEMDESEEASQETIDDDTKEENREAEASPSSNTRQRAMAAAAASGNVARGATARRSTRSSFGRARGSRPTPIVWDSQASPRGKPR